MTRPGHEKAASLSMGESTPTDGRDYNHDEAPDVQDIEDDGHRARPAPG